MAIGRLLRACGFQIESTPGTEPCTFDHDLALILGTDPAASAAYFLADQMNAEIARISRAMAEEGEVFFTVRRVGDTMFDVDVLDALDAAGVRIEERRDGVTLHLPNGGGAVDGRGLAQAFVKPLTPVDLPPVIRGARNQPDYLRHDPTKRHRRVRSK
jgi:catechol 2,3-dioxygenase-like lactoylglutathione lyase family enzyme